MSVKITLGRIDSKTGFRARRIERTSEWGVRERGFEVSIPTGHYLTVMRK
jgi:hypothetical protein